MMHPCRALRLRVPRLKPLASSLAFALAVGVTASSSVFATSPRAIAQRPTFAAAMGSAPALAADPRVAQWKRLHPQPPPRLGSTWTVTNCDDDGAGSLRDIIENDAASGDTVDMSELTCATITLTTGSIVTGADDLTLIGPSTTALIIDGDHAFQPLAHLGEGTLILRDLTIRNGLKYASGTDSARGGCVYSAGSVSMDGVSLKYCEAIASDTGSAVGGGVFAMGGLSLQNSSITSSLSSSSGGSAWGGGAYLRGGLLMKYSDIHDNEVRSSPNTQNARGGGIWNAYGGGTVSRSTISNNRGGTVGGMLLSGITGGGEIAILSSTVSGNVATNSRSGAGLYIGYSSGFTLDNSTITGNSEDNFENVSYGAGLKLGDNTPATLTSSIVSGNVFVRGGGSRPSDIYGEFSTSLAGDHNLIGFSYLMPPPDTIGYLSDAGLAPLGFNGGPTRTHALLPGSIALNAGAANGQSEDQRGDGYPRAQGSSADIGAFESDILFADGFD